MELTYTQCGDYLIPNLVLADTKEYHIGKYGRMRRAYLKEHRPILYTDLIVTEKLLPHLEEIDIACRERLEIIEKAMMQQEGVTEALKAADYLDSLTVYKDRRAYPHKLANAIITYKLEDKVQNSHRAIDDVAVLFEVCKAMDAERSDLLSYVNVFGYNPKYGVSGKRIEKVAYWPQNFNKYMQAPSYTLPAKLRQRRR